LCLFLETGHEGSNGCISHVGIQESPIEFSVDPEVETGREEDSEDDDNDDDDVAVPDEEDTVAEAGHGSESVVTEQLHRTVTEDDLPPQNVSLFDKRQKCSGFIDVWWLFDDGGV